jgi:hypothetical protein
LRVRPLRDIRLLAHLVKFGGQQVHRQLHQQVTRSDNAFGVEDIPRPFGLNLEELLIVLGLHRYVSSC